MVAVAIEAVAEKLVGMGTRCAVGVSGRSRLWSGGRGEQRGSSHDQAPDAWGRWAAADQTRSLRPPRGASVVGARQCDGIEDLAGLIHDNDAGSVGGILHVTPIYSE